MFSIWRILEDGSKNPTIELEPVLHLKRGERIWTFSSFRQNLHAIVISQALTTFTLSDLNGTRSQNLIIFWSIRSRGDSQKTERTQKTRNCFGSINWFTNIKTWLGGLYHHLPDNIYNLLHYRPGGELTRNLIHDRKLTCHYQAFNLSEIWQIDP